MRKRGLGRSQGRNHKKNNVIIRKRGEDRLMQMKRFNLFRMARGHRHNRVVVISMGGRENRTPGGPEGNEGESITIKTMGDQAAEGERDRPRGNSRVGLPEIEKPNGKRREKDMLTSGLTHPQEEEEKNPTSKKG